MQLLLHQALASTHAFGFLAGRENTIEAVFPVTESMLIASASNYESTEFKQAQFDAGPLTLMGVYQATDNNGNIDTGRTNQLASYFKKQSGNKACCYLLLELGTEGRLDALMFADQERSIPIPLDMQEDDTSVPNCPE